MAELEKAFKEQMQETQDTIDDVIAALERRQERTIDHHLSAIYYTLLGRLFDFVGYIGLRLAPN